MNLFMEKTIFFKTARYTKLFPIKHFKFAVDTLGDFCSVAIIFLKKLAKIKFEKIHESKAFQDLTASTWVNTTCKDLKINSDYQDVRL